MALCLRLSLCCVPAHCWSCCWSSCCAALHAIALPHTVPWSRIHRNSDCLSCRLTTPVSVLSSHLVCSSVLLCSCAQYTFLCRQRYLDLTGEFRPVMLGGVHAQAALDPDGRAFVCWPVLPVCCLCCLSSWLSLRFPCGLLRWLISCRCCCSIPCTPIPALACSSPRWCGCLLHSLAGRVAGQELGTAGDRPRPRRPRLCWSRSGAAFGACFCVVIVFSLPCGA